jgi:hypothetical protein
MPLGIAINSWECLSRLELIHGNASREFNEFMGIHLEGEENLCECLSGRE